MGASTDIGAELGTTAIDHSEPGHTSPVCLSLPARPESVAAARHAVADLGARLGYSQLRLHDLRTVVSEACMNAAVHAYEEPGGEFEVWAAPRVDGMRIDVSDRGTGIRPRPAFDSPSARLGVLLIAALASSVEISSRSGGGTNLRIEFNSTQRH
jgi:serine/threonine-protein kinase RsbW